jgi:hypothetical protein
MPKQNVSFPDVQAVQLIGKGTIRNHEGLATAAGERPSHGSMHKNPVSPADNRADVKRNYCWHIAGFHQGLSSALLTYSSTNRQHV